MTPSSGILPTPTVAIVGSGPSGCYTAQFLRKALADAQITVFEALPTPYGLVRYGVAADHQGSKAVTGQFDRIFERMGVTFAGNVRIGQDLAFTDLAAQFDVVVLATGLPADRCLEVPVDPAARVVGAGAIVRALNGHPDHGPEQGPGPLGEDVVIVGHGNVAMDVARFLAKCDDEFDGSDIDDDALARIRPRRVRSVRVVGRSGAAAAKFDLAMLREFGHLRSALVRAEGLEEATGPVAELLAEISGPAGPGSGAPTPEEPTVVTFHFNATPSGVSVEGDRTVLQVRDTRTGAVTALEADTLVTAIGFCQTGDPGAVDPDDSWSGAHVYRVGWLGRGPRGTVAENRKHAQQVAAAVLADLREGRIATGRPGLDALPPPVRQRMVDFSAWKAVEAVEVAAAAPNRCRRKITDLTALLTAAGRDPADHPEPAPTA